MRFIRHKNSELKKQNVNKRNLDLIFFFLIKLRKKYYIPRKGGMAERISLLPYKNPTPVGPHIWRMFILNFKYSMENQLHTTCHCPHLVRGSNKKISVQSLNINHHVWNTLTSIYKHFCSNIMRPTYDFIHWKNRSCMKWVTTKKRPMDKKWVNRNMGKRMHKEKVYPDL